MPSPSRWIGSVSRRNLADSTFLSSDCITPVPVHRSLAMPPILLGQRATTADLARETQTAQIGTPPRRTSLFLTGTREDGGSSLLLVTFALMSCPPLQVVF